MWKGPPGVARARCRSASRFDDARRYSHGFDRIDELIVDDGRPARVVSYGISFRQARERAADEASARRAHRATAGWHPRSFLAVGDPSLWLYPDGRLHLRL